MDYAAHYDKLISRAKERTPQSALIERHHIKPRCVGGGNEPSNIANLTPEEHYIAHLLLAKLHPQNKRLAFAALTMGARSPALKVPRNKRYGRARRAETSLWGRLRVGNAIRCKKRKRRGYTKEQVAILARMLRPVAETS